VVEGVRNDLQLPPAAALGLHRANSPSEPSNDHGHEHYISITAAWATVMDRAQTIFANMDQEAVAEAVHFQHSPEDVVTDFTRRLVELRQTFVNAATQVLPDDPGRDLGQAAAPSPVPYQMQTPTIGHVDDLDFPPPQFQFHQDDAAMLPDPPQVPTIGGAGDFDVPPPHYAPNLGVDTVHLVDSDMGTLSSAQGYHTDSGFSPYLQSFFGSSQTSQDFGNAMIHNQMQTPAVPSPTALGNSTPYFPEFQQRQQLNDSYLPQYPVEQHDSTQIHTGFGPADESSFYPLMDFGTPPELNDEYNGVVNQELSDID
jgi:hypothetical protein